MNSLKEKKQISWKQNLAVVWFSQLLCMAGFCSALPFIPVFMRVELGIEDPGLRGVYVAIFYFSSMTSFCIFTPVWGALADRFGSKLMLLRASFCGAVLMPLMGLSPNITVLIILRFITSCFSGTVNAAQMLIAATTPPEKHGFALGVASSAVWSGNVLGFCLGGIVVHYFGYTTAFFFCGLMFLISGLMILFFVHEDFVPPVKKTLETKEKKLNGLFKIFHLDLPQSVWMLLLLFFMMAFSRRFDDAYLALQVENIAGKINTELYTGYISAGAAIGGVLAGGSIGYLVDRFSAAKVALPCLICGGLFVLGQGLAQNLLFLGVCRFFAFIAAGGLEPVFLSMLSKNCSPEKRGEIFGFTTSARSIGMMVASPFGAVIIYFLGVRSIFVAAAIGFALTIPVFLYTVRLCRKNEDNIKEIPSI